MSTNDTQSAVTTVNLRAKTHATAAWKPSLSQNSVIPNHEPKKLKDFVSKLTSNSIIKTEEIIPDTSAKSSYTVDDLKNFFW